MTFNLRPYIGGYEAQYEISNIKMLKVIVL